MFILTPPELQVIDALSNGATLNDAAAQAGVHRNTIANWRLNSPEFREALALVRHDRAVLYRERAIELADLAFETLRAVLTDPKSSPSVRLRAAIFIINKATAPPNFEQEDAVGMANLDRLAQNRLPMHNFAQTCPTMHSPSPKPSREKPPRCTILHKSRQPTCPMAHSLHSWRGAAGSAA
ncbi:MAG: hypothetical protein ABSH56_31970 [Bryobacteraceae bacterium]|jgi:hypothetical protein